jgi:penicillin amidase
MRIVPFIIATLVTLLLVIILSTRWLLPAPLGTLLSPQHGIWQNAEPVDEDFNATLHFKGLKGKTEVYLDERLVPHVFAENDEDVFFVQGYLHARFRLWQMDFQVRAAGGRLGEILGATSGTTDILNNVDRYFRRLGMVYAAEKSLSLMERDPLTGPVINAYTAGVNAYINTLAESRMPIEYKLMGYKPELWTNLKTALFLKYMSYDLAGAESDFEYTAARNAFSKAVYDKLYPLVQDSADPIVSRGTIFDPPAVHPVMPASADSLYLTFHKDSVALPVLPRKPDRENGSNNWAVSGSKTRSHYPILCNDPHLGLNLPSLWFEMQLTTPRFNAYGASFPCAPGVIIGFNDSCAFGVTNAGRDVRDYYDIRFKDASKKQYWFNGAWKDTRFRMETIHVKNQPDFIDTVAYTVFGPVIFDDKYLSRNKDGKSYAVRWKAHDASNELKAFYELDACKNYSDYVHAAKELHTPGQNIIFAAKNGDIALRAQGEFPAKWQRQGDFVMPGTDSSYMWQGMIPQDENPRMYNPERGFVSSANQVPADSTYRYYLGSAYPPYRGLTINRRLAGMQNITPQDMMKLQNDNFDAFAELALPIFIKAVTKPLSANESRYWEILKNWNYRNDPDEKGATIFSAFLDSLRMVVWADELAPLKKYQLPFESTLLEALLKDSAYMFLDNVNTPAKETLGDDVVLALQQAIPAFDKAEQAGGLEWWKVKDTRITHLTKLMEFSRQHLKTGGGVRSINATKSVHGPSWRMIVHLTPETEAYGVYPGGQNGNPGSKYYDNFIDTWAGGEYYPLLVLKKSDNVNEHIRWRMMFSHN